MDHPLMILAAGHAGACALGLIAGGFARSPEAHRLLVGRLALVAAIYLAAACAWADWLLAGAGGALVGIAPALLGAVTGWAFAAVHRGFSTLHARR